MFSSEDTQIPHWIIRTELNLPVRFKKDIAFPKGPKLPQPRDQGSLIDAFYPHLNLIFHFVRACTFF